MQNLRFEPIHQCKQIRTHFEPMAARLFSHSQWLPTDSAPVSWFTSLLASFKQRPGVSPDWIPISTPCKFNLILPSHSWSLALVWTPPHEHWANHANVSSNQLRSPPIVTVWNINTFSVLVRPGLAICGHSHLWPLGGGHQGSGVSGLAFVSASVSFSLQRQTFASDPEA